MSSEQTGSGDSKNKQQHHSLQYHLQKNRSNSPVMEPALHHIPPKASGSEQEASANAKIEKEQTVPEAVKAENGTPRAGGTGHMDFKHRISEERRRSKSPAARASSNEEGRRPSFGIEQQVPVKEEQPTSSGAGPMKPKASEDERSVAIPTNVIEGRRSDDFRHSPAAEPRSSLEPPPPLSGNVVSGAVAADAGAGASEERRQLEQQDQVADMLAGAIDMLAGAVAMSHTESNMEKQMLEAQQVTMADIEMIDAPSGVEEAEALAPALPPPLPLQRLATKEEEEGDPDLLAAVQHRDLHGQPKKRKVDMLANENLVTEGTPGTHTLSNAVSETSGDTIIENTPDKVDLATSLIAFPSEVGTLPADMMTAAPAAEILPKLEKMRLGSKSVAPGMTVAQEGQRVSSKKGFRTARTNFGVDQGTFVCEVVLEQLGPDAHARLGFISHKGELQAPVGFDAYGYGYRDIDGTKCHKAKRTEFGEGFQEKDVIGMLIHLPGSVDSKVEEAAKDQHAPSAEEGLKREHKVTDLPAPSSQDSQNPKDSSKIMFFKNGVYQGVAFSDLPVGEYFPCASLFTSPENAGASVIFNFGESSFSHNYSEMLMQSNKSDLSQLTKEEIAKEMKALSTLERPAPVANMNRKWPLV